MFLQKWKKADKEWPWLGNISLKHIYMVEIITEAQEQLLHMHTQRGTFSIIIKKTAGKMFHNAALFKKKKQPPRKTKTNKFEMLQIIKQKYGNTNY